jgi:inorganic pyrophosphatase
MTLQASAKSPMDWRHYLVMGIIALLGMVSCFMVDTLLLGIFVMCLLMQGVAYLMGKHVLSIDEGSEQMRAVSDYIREGSEAYVAEMFGTILVMMIPATVLIFLLYWYQRWVNSEKFIGCVVITFAFVTGAVCSSLAGMIGMWTSTRANIRVARTACQGTFRKTIVVALRSGAVVGITVVSMAVLGISFLFSMSSLVMGNTTKPEKTPELLVGYGFGASLVAMFAQLGGGIYTKAADVGADLCGKIELGIPEDDPRNPAVIADLVGDNVGDCCARGADLFESLAAEIIAAMILGATLTLKARGGEDKMDTTTLTSTTITNSTIADLRHLGGIAVDDQEVIRFILFPLVVHVMDLVVSTIGVLSVSSTAASEVEDPMDVLKKGCGVAIALAASGFVTASYFMLYMESAPHAWWHFAVCGLVGMVCGYCLVLITEYYTDFRHQPVRNIALASESGHGTNVIAGLGVGMESTAAPILLVSAAILAAYYLGRTSGIGENDETSRTAGGLFGTAVATMGMLSNLTYVLAMDVFGPITDNAAGIVEMSSDCPATARDTMDRLDAAGNTTKAFTKGFAVGSAGLACFLLFRAFLDIAEAYSDETIRIDIVQPEVFIGGLIGCMTVYLFAAFAMQAVGSSAQEVVGEVRRQFRDIPGIADGSARPEYGNCVGIVSRSAIRLMVKPGVLVVLMPIGVGLFFRLVGDLRGDKLLGVTSMTAYLVCSSMSAMLMALLLNNGGGAWDNAKKYIESGQHGGKGSEAHKAAITGDTVGDPCKDTAGPSLHVLMKLTATVTMVVGPLVAVPHKSD